MKQPNCDKNNKIVDFIVIGAARSGTTSLAAYLRSHPSIYFPLEKETCFFSDNDRYDKGVDWYLQNYFYCSKSENKIFGEATPAYMLFEYVPERIFKTTPNTKLIAILRNPIHRAYSHYRFAKRLGIESRSFNDAIMGLLHRGKISDAQITSQNLEYTMFGEYGRILNHYLNFFNKDQLKILFFEDLKNNPEQTMKSVFQYLSIDNTYTADEFSKRHNVGGEARFQSVLKIQKCLKSNKFLKDTILKIFPVKVVGAVDMWLTSKGNVKEVRDNGPDKESIDLLKNHYFEDVQLLQRLFNFVTPWPDFLK